MGLFRISRFSWFFILLCSSVGVIYGAPDVKAYHAHIDADSEPVIVKRPIDGGIREIVSSKLREKYQKWKTELLATEFGKREWDKYAANKNFILTITISDKEGQGAGSGKYKWDETGALVGATITLGDKIDKGYPNPTYFPVMNSLFLNDSSRRVEGEILAAAKIAHEFGHVNLTGKTNSQLFQLQNKLMPVYNEILLENGYKTNDPRLAALEAQMGGTPVQIWENREYWGEANALNYLLDRINKENFYCLVMKKIKHNVRIYARDYEQRFDEIAGSSLDADICRQ